MNATNFLTTKKKLRVPNQDFFAHIKEALHDGNDVVLPVKGVSMVPFLRNGDRLLVKPIAKSDFKLGKVVLANTKYGIILHRIVAMRKEWIYMAGDGNLMQIEKVHKKDVWAVGTAVMNGSTYKNIQRFSIEAAALLWFLLRPFRIVVHKLFGKRKK